MGKREKTNYAGVFYRKAKRIGRKGTEKVYYVVYKKNGKVLEEKAGRQFADDMSPARAAGIRAELIEGKRLTRKEKRGQEQAFKDAKANKWTIDRLWVAYKENKPNLKGMVTDENRFDNYIKPNFGDKEPKDIIPLDVDRLRLKLLKTKAPGTVKNVLELLRRIVNFAGKKNLCEGLNFTIEMPKVNSLKTEDLTPGQLSNLLKAIDEADNIQAANMMKLALFTGMRRGEMFKLKWDHIDFDRGFINLIDPKGGPDQKIPLNDAARELLQSHPRTKSQFVFPGRGGRQRTDIKHQVNKIKDDAGLPKDFRALHGLRHVYASMLASSGEVDMYTLQKLLTHKSPLMTQRYAHLRDETLKKASDLAGDIIEQAASGSNKEKVVNLDNRKK
jgi:integrase